MIVGSYFVIQRVIGVSSLLLLFLHIEVVIETILKRDFVEVLAHLLAPLITNTISKPWEPAARRQLRHKLFAVLPFFQSLDLFDLPCFTVFAYVEKGWSVADYA